MVSAPPPSILQQLIEWIETSGVPGLIINWTSAIFAFLFVTNVRAVVLFFKRTIDKKDNLIVGDWYIYRYTISRGKPTLILDTWTIRRTPFSKTYVVDVMASTGSNRPSKSLGKLVYNERDRFSILFEGVDHKEQSLISFSPRIPVSIDTRILGLGLGDDADYMLSARPYLACRTQLSIETAEKILGDAIEALRHEVERPTVRFSPEVMDKIFLSNPMPNETDVSAADPAL